MDLVKMLPFLIPIFIIEMILMVAALVHIAKHPTYRTGSRALWIPVVILFQIVGPVLYFVIGKDNTED